MDFIRVKARIQKYIPTMPSTYSTVQVRHQKIKSVRDVCFKNYQPSHEHIFWEVTGECKAEGGPSDCL